MGNETTTSSRIYIDIELGGALLLLFIALKLTGQITWPWVWVLSPVWLGMVLVVLVFLTAGTGWLAYAAGRWVWDQVWEWRRRKGRPPVRPAYQRWHKGKDDQ